MIRIVKADKVYGVVTIEIGEEDVRKIIESVDNMVAKQQRTLLENLPSEDQVRQRLDEYNALKEELRKIWESLNQ
jgi:hypothetical protein